MYSVKVELDKNICYGCLSTDRQLSQLETHITLFYSLLEYELCDTAILLCWECKALLNKIQAFRKRIQRAQNAIRQCLLNDKCENLSTLITTNTDFFDHIIEYKENEDKQQIHIKEFQTNEDKQLIEQPVDVDRNDEIIDSTPVPEEEIDIKQESDDNDDTYSDYRPDAHTDDEKPGKTRRQAYMEYLKITDSMNEDDIKNYCVRVTLGAREIEELIEGEEREKGKLRVSSDTWKCRYMCKECDKGFRYDIDYRRHLNFNHVNRNTTSKLRCKYCKKGVTNWRALEQHWMKYHNRYYRCAICGSVKRRSDAVVAHIEACHSKVYSCAQCGKTVSGPREFRRHYKETHVRIVCDHCGKSFIKKKTLETHIKRHHQPATCEICHRTYDLYHSLENHCRLNHPELFKTQKKELAYCVECNKQFPSVYKYRRHLTAAAVHTAPKVQAVPCPECGKVFSRKIRMTNHVMSVHRKNTKHRCDICNKTFCSAYSVKTHIQCVHEKIPMPKNKFCDICGRGFSTNRILCNHRRTHTGERPFPCAHCPATFTQRVARNTHARTQHKNVEK